MSGHGGRLCLLVVVALAGFVWLCHAIPQLQAQPEEETTVEIDVGDAPEQLVEVGRRVFQSDRAQCLTCHSLGPDPKARCPDQEGVGERSATRRPGYTAAQYLVESVYNPNAFVVSGYPSNQMTPVDKPPIALTHQEILAILAFLNTLGGRTDQAFVSDLRAAQDPYRKGLVRIEESADPGGRLPLLAGDTERGARAFENAKCLACHKVGTEGAGSAPDLSAIGALQPPEYLLQSLLEPSAVIVRGYQNSRIELKDGSIRSGIVVDWVPSQEGPERVVVRELSATDTVEYALTMSEIRAIGDTIVLTGAGSRRDPHVGYVVEGNVNEGLALRTWQEGEWAVRRFAAGEIAQLNPTLSPMPSDMGTQLPVRDVYDIVAYLGTLKKVE